MAIVAEYQGFEFEFPDGTTDEQIYKFLQDNATQMMDNYSGPQTSELPVSPVASDLGTLSRKERPVQEVVVPEDAYTADGGINTQSDFWKGKSAIQIYEEAYGRSGYGVNTFQPESQAVSGMTENVDQKIDAETWIKNRADEFLRDNMDMTRREAMKKAEDAYEGEVVDIGTELAMSLAAPARLYRTAKGAAATTGVIAGTSTAAGNLVAGRDVSENVVQNASIGALVGAGGKQLENAFAGTRAPKSIKDLNALGQEAAAMRQEYDLAVKKMREQASLTPGSNPTALKKQADELFENMMRAPLPSNKNVTANDVETAMKKATVIADNPKLLSGTSDVSKQIDNPELRKLLDSAALSIEKGGTIKRSVLEIVGAKTPGLQRKRSDAIAERSAELFNDIGLYADNGSFISPSVHTALEELKKAATLTGKLDFDSSKKAISNVNKILDKNAGQFGVTEQKLINNIKNELQTLNKINVKAGDTNPYLDAFKSSVALLGPTIGGVVGGGTLGASAAVGAGAYAGKRALSNYSNKVIGDRVQLVKQALGGKASLDERALQMIEDNMAIGDVIAYIALKDIAGK